MDINEMKPVKSSNIEAVGYHGPTNTMAVRFKNGGTYHYHDVSVDQHHAMMNAESIGAHLAKHVKPHHQHTKIEKETT